MSSRFVSSRIFILLLAPYILLTATSRGSLAQDAAVPRPLITQSVDESQLTVLHGNTHPLARPAFDLGAAPSSLPMQRMLLVLKRSPEQEFALRQMLDQQQTKSSSGYHSWLTPQQFGKQFGPADSDLQIVTNWLQSHGFQVAEPSNGRTVIEFSGTAGQVKEAFHTTIHKYLVNGEQHWANASDPSIPSALAPVVSGIVSLHNFPRQAHSTLMGSPVRAAAHPAGTLPLFTFTQQQTTLYGLGPTDFATIYNVLPLWSEGIDGTGQTIAIVGESDIHLSDVEAFRSIFGLPAHDPTVILNGPDPGVVGDETEALLDVSWSGAVAKGATIDFVVSASTESALGVDLSALYIVDNDIAPVVSESYGICEATLGNAGNAFYNAIWQQAAAEGITVLVSAGDAGSAGCDNFDIELGAVDGLAVSGFASTPNNVAVGGTDFDQTPATAPTYWNATNNTTTGASAKSYIPETAWNDSCAGLGVDGCTEGINSNLINIIAGSGGPSSCSSQGTGGSCLSGYSKPSWQTGSGVPLDGVRDTPDVSLFASNGFNNSFYIICQADAGFLGTQETCSLQNFTFVGVGGTSASAPAFAGIMALVNQKMQAQGSSPRQGNANYLLYKLAAQPGDVCDSSTVALTGNSCVFYDITKGNNSVPCNPNTPDCGPAPPNGLLGILEDPNNAGNPAWLTTAGYDLATGLGSVNVENLVDSWASATFTPSVTTLSNVSPLSVTHGQPVSVSVTVAAESGSGTPTGSVALMAAPAGQTFAAGVFPLTNGAASGSTTFLPGGTYNVTAHYAGDATFGGSDSGAVQVTVNKENSQTKLSLEAFNIGTRIFSQTNTITYGEPFFLRGDVANAAGASCIPSPQQTQVACPSGTVSFTDNGKTLDAGTYPLNSQGYTEDQTLTPEFTSLGSYALQGQYSGDNSFNPSSGTLNAQVTQGPTNIELEVLAGGAVSANPVVWSGQSFQVVSTAYTQSVLLAPTGTISILQNGGPVAGTLQLNSRSGSYSGNYSSGEFYVALLSGNITTAINTPGTYTFTSSYAGDANYLASQSPYSITLTVLDTTFNISTPISNVSITAPGQSGTASVGLIGTDNFFGTVTVSCALPAAMKEANCPTTMVTLSNTATAQLNISTTAPHQIASNYLPAGIYGVGMAVGVFVFAIPGIRRRKLHLAVLLASVALMLSCSGGNNSGGGGGGQTDPGTPAGTYTVNVTATSAGITRTASFNVTVQ